MFTFLPENYIAGGHQKITIADSVVNLFSSYLTLIKPTSGTFSGKMATALLITVETYPIYYTLDNTDPATTGTTGHSLEVGDVLSVYDYQNIKRLKMIRQGSNTGYVKVTAFFNSVGVAAGDPT